MAGKSWQPSHEPPRRREDRQPPHWLNSGKKGMEGGGGGSLKTCPHTLTLNAIPVMAANTFQSEHMWNPDACTYQNTADYKGNAGALCC